MEPILEFKGQFEWLSNFHPTMQMTLPSPEIGRVIWVPTAEHAYQAAKAEFEVDWLEVCQAPTPGKAKKIGRRIQMPEWTSPEDLLHNMQQVIWRKFDASPMLVAKLLATGDRELQEGNTWNDRRWGISPPGSGRGHNLLGKILMAERAKRRGARECRSS